MAEGLKRLTVVILYKSIIKATMVRDGLDYVLMASH